MIEPFKSEKNKEHEYLEFANLNAVDDKETYLKNRDNYMREQYIQKYGLKNFLNNGITIRQGQNRNRGEIKEKAKAFLQRISSPEYLSDPK
jgi:hypothetical protein